MVLLECLRGRASNVDPDTIDSIIMNATKPATEELVEDEEVNLHEAHRFAITHHRKRRLKKNFRSSIDDIPGIGPSRRAALLRHLGSLKAVREASLETLSSVPGFNSALAERVYQWYQDAGNIDAAGD